MGDVTARISSVVPLWQQTDNRSLPVVHHIVAPLEPYTGPPGGLRGQLGIPADAAVICRHGGRDTFDIPAARAAVCAGLHYDTFPGAYFVFVNTDALPCEHARLIHLSMITNTADKRAFLATCDACLHARRMGESFGLAVAECAQAGLPVITSRIAPADGRAHLNILGSAAVLYSPDVPSVIAAVVSVLQQRAEHKARAVQYAHLYDRFAPAMVMVDLIEAFGLDMLVPRRPGSEGTAEARAAGRCGFTHTPRLNVTVLGHDRLRALAGAGPPRAALTERALRHDDVCCRPE